MQNIRASYKHKTTDQCNSVTHAYITNKQKQKIFCIDFLHMAVV